MKAQLLASGTACSRLKWWSWDPYPPPPSKRMGTEHNDPRTPQGSPHTHTHVSLFPRTPCRRPNMPIPHSNMGCGCGLGPSHVPYSDHTQREETTSRMRGAVAWPGGENGCKEPVSKNNLRGLQVVNSSAWDRLAQSSPEIPSAVC